MTAKQRALYLLNKLPNNENPVPFSTIEDAIIACSLVSDIFIREYPPLTHNYWVEVRKELELIRNAK